MKEFLKDLPSILIVAAMLLLILSFQSEDAYWQIDILALEEKISPFRILIVVIVMALYILIVYTNKTMRKILKQEKRNTLLFFLSILTVIIYFFSIEIVKYPILQINRMHSESEMIRNVIFTKIEDDISIQPEYFDEDLTYPIDIDDRQTVKYKFKLGWLGIPFDAEKVD